MKNLFEPLDAAAIASRVARISSNNIRQWGKMSSAQAMAHCAVALEWAVDDNRPPRMLLGRVLGGMMRNRVTRDESPLARNTPTAPQLIMTSSHDLEAEKARVTSLIARFSAGGHAGCTTHPHTFFGRMSPEQWAILMHKHLDHHLRQFGA